MGAGSIQALEFLIDVLCWLQKAVFFEKINYDIYEKKNYNIIMCRHFSKLTL